MALNLASSVTQKKQHRPGIAPNDNTMHVTTVRSSANLTERNQTPNAIHLRPRHNNPTNSHTPSRMKSTHTCCTYTGMRPHVPGEQAGDHLVPAHTERQNQSKVWTQRQAGGPPRAVSSPGHRHRCRSSGKQALLGWPAFQLLDTPWQA